MHFLQQICPRSLCLDIHHLMKILRSQLRGTYADVNVSSSCAIQTPLRRSAGGDRRKTSVLVMTNCTMKVNYC